MTKSTEMSQTNWDFFKHNKRLQIIIALDLLAFILFVTSFFLPITSGYAYDFVGLAFYLIRGLGLPFLAFFLLFWSIFFTYQLKPGRALILKGISWVILFSLIIYIIFGNYIPYSSISSFNVGDQFLFIGVIILTVSLILEGIWRNQLLIQKYNEVREYIKALSESHDQVHLFEIARNQSLDQRFIPKIKQEIEIMIDIKEINAELKGNRVIFRKGVERAENKIARKTLETELEPLKQKKITFIIGLDFIIFILFIISFSLPIFSSPYGSDPIPWGFPPFPFPIFLVTSLLIILWSMFFSYQIKPGRSLVLKGISGGILLSYIIFFTYLNLINDYSLNIGIIMVIVNEIILMGNLLLEGILRPSILEQKYGEVEKYVKDLSEKVDQVHLSTIVQYQELDLRYIPSIKQEIESMIDSNKIHAELKQDNIVFKEEKLIGSKPSEIPEQKPKEEIESKKDEIPLKDVKLEREKKPKKVAAIERDIDYRKRLYGMIRVEKEIELEEAAEFLNLSEKKLKAYIYDLAGENKIQGSFTEEGKFIIESGVDNFLDALDSQFNKWEYEEKV